jgi:hypothetical protein
MSDNLDIAMLLNDPEVYEKFKKLPNVDKIAYQWRMNWLAT